MIDLHYSKHSRSVPVLYFIALLENVPKRIEHWSWSHTGAKLASHAFSQHSTVLV